MSAGPVEGLRRGIDDVTKSDRTYPRQYMQMDERPPHEELLDERAVYLGSDDISIDRYVDREFHDREMEHVWRKTWQVACHESELSEVGDTVVYDIGKYSILVVRSDVDRVKAFYNSCLHRGTQLRDVDGPVAELRCPFHGWAYSLDGKLVDLPESWDFDHVDQREMMLSEVRVGTWGGWIFVNMDRDAAPLDEYLGPLRLQFESIRPYRRYVVTHAVIKNIPCNWKVTQDAFFEVYHCDETHPQMMVATDCYDAENSVYLDGGGHLSSRMIVPVAVPGAGGHHQVTEQDVIDNLFADRVRGQASLGAGREQLSAPVLAEGELARPQAVKIIRKLKEQMLGIDLSDASDSEVIDAMEYAAFPNFMPWAGYQNCMAYRFRPDGDDHTRSIMDVWLMNPVDENSDAPVPHGPDPVVVDAANGVGDVAELGRFTVVLQQDLDNLPKVQRGLETSDRGAITVGNYQEVRLRHFHQVLDRYVGGE